MLLGGRETGYEITEEESKVAKADGLLVIFGYSDDNVELRGFIDDEIVAYNGTTLYLHSGGLLTDPSGGTCEHCAERSRNQAAKCASVSAVWDEPDCPPWNYHTNLPHAKFDIKEDDGVFCCGIVIDSKDLPTISTVLLPVDYGK